MKINIHIDHEGTEKEMYGSGGRGFGSNGFTMVVHELMRYEAFQIAMIRYYHDELANHLMKKENSIRLRIKKRKELKKGQKVYENAKKQHTSRSVHTSKEG